MKLIALFAIWLIVLSLDFILLNLFTSCRNFLFSDRFFKKDLKDKDRIEMAKDMARFFSSITFIAFWLMVISMK